MAGFAEHDERTRRLLRLLQEEAPPAGDPFPCPYLSGRWSRNVTIFARALPAGLYHSLMDLNFRRTGRLFYRPQCEGCSECRMLRVPVATFRPSRAQRRCGGRNRDLTVTVGKPLIDEEKRSLYARYLEARHDGQMDGSDAELRDFLYSSSLETVEISYRVEGRLLGVGIADVEPLALSAVYCFFDPQEGRRSLGVFNVLTLIEECRRRGVPHLYLGYHVPGSPRMAYKASYRPCERLGADGRFSPFPASSR